MANITCSAYDEKRQDCCGLKDVRSKTNCNGDLMLCAFSKDSRIIPVVEDAIRSLPKHAVWARRQLKEKYLD